MMRSVEVGIHQSADGYTRTNRAADFDLCHCYLWPLPLLATGLLAVSRSAREVAQEVAHAATNAPQGRSDGGLGNSAVDDLHRVATARLPAGGLCLPCSCALSKRRGAWERAGKSCAQESGCVPSERRRARERAVRRCTREEQEPSGRLWKNRAAASAFILIYI
jgi:hypothetical protein